MKADESVDKVTRINRRQAMKAGLGGAAAAAALSVPNIEHFSLAPDVASASSMCAPGSTVTGSPASIIKNQSTGGFLGTTHCWGSYSGGCQNSNIGSITVAAASGSYTGPSFAFTVGGQVSNTNGTLSFVTTNFTTNQPYSSCSVGITGSCSNGTFTVENGISPTNNVTANGTSNGRIYCNGGVLANGSVTVAVTCTCGP